MVNMENRPRFDAVIEGDFLGDPGGSFFKLARLAVPPEATVLKSRPERFILHGKTADYRTLQLVGSDIAPREVHIADVAEGPGLTLPYHDGGFNMNLLSDPDAIFLDDGRVYVEQRARLDQKYVAGIASLLPQVGELFRGAEADVWWQSVSQNHLEGRSFYPI